MALHLFALLILLAPTRPPDMPTDAVIEVTFDNVERHPPPPKLMPPRPVKSLSTVRKAKPSPPRPKADAHTEQQALLHEEAPPVPNVSTPSDIPEGSAEGFSIGGEGDAGGDGGGGCARGGYYLTLITSQLRDVFMRNEKTDSRKFHVEANVWFDPTGRLERTQLVESTGYVSLDATVTRLLGEIRVGRGMPACLQPVMVIVSDPWEGPIDGGDPSKQVWMRSTPGH